MVYFHRGLLLFDMNMDKGNACDDLRKAYSLGFMQNEVLKIIKKYCN